MPIIDQYPVVVFVENMCSSRHPMNNLSGGIGKSRVKLYSYLVSYHINNTFCFFVVAALGPRKQQWRPYRCAWTECTPDMVFSYSTSMGVGVWGNQM